MSHNQADLVKIYQSVIDDVISGVRDIFLDEGVDEQVLHELKQIWEQKLEASKAIEKTPEPSREPQPPQYLQKDIGRNNLPSKTGSVYSYSSAQNAAHNANQQQSSMVGHHHQGQGSQNQSQAAQSQGHQSTQPQSQTQKQAQDSQRLQTMSQQQNQQQIQHHHQQMQQQQQQQPQQPPQSNAQQPNPAQTVIVTDPGKQVPIQITLPAQAGGEPRVLTIQVPAYALQGNQLQQVLTGSVITATMALPVHLASSLLQQHVNAALQGQVAATMQQNNVSHQSNPIRQLDGMDAPCDSSDEEEEEDDDEDVDDEEENEEREEDENEEENIEEQEEEPLNSGDDVSEEDLSDLFDTDNVVVCQYDKITRSRNKWKFHLKDGIMNLNGKDFVFLKAQGDAEW